MHLKLLLCTVFIIGIVSSCNAQFKKGISADTAQQSYWNLEKAKKQATGFNSPDQWDTKTLQMEVENLAKNPPSDLPLYRSPFPTPAYSSPGNGNGSIETQISGKKIIGHNVIMAKGAHSEHLFTNPDDKFITYFAVLTIADGVESSNPVSATSRNHPHYLAQGSLNTTTKSLVDWVAIQLADKNAYAIINERIFDLRAGRIILVAPQKNGSIRFFQTDTSPMNAKERDTYIENLESDKKTIDFFAGQGNI